MAGDLLGSLGKSSFGRHDTRDLATGIARIDDQACLFHQGSVIELLVIRHDDHAIRIANGGVRIHGSVDLFEPCCHRPQPAVFTVEQYTKGKDKQIDLEKGEIGQHAVPTIVGDQHLYYIYRKGSIMSVGGKYKEATALEAIDKPLDPRAAVKLNGDTVRGIVAAMVFFFFAWAAGLFKEEHWVTLIRARAIENTVWVAAAGQVPDPASPVDGFVYVALQELATRIAAKSLPSLMATKRLLLDVVGRDLEVLQEAGVAKIHTIYVNDLDQGPYISQTLKLDDTPDQTAARVGIYRMMRPGEPPTEEAVEALFHGLFFSEERYDLSPVGRMKFNRRIGRDELTGAMTFETRY